MPKNTSPKIKSATSDNHTVPGEPKLTWLAHKTFEIELTVPQEKITAGYQQALAAIAKTAQIAGFREGKAPAKMVEEKVGKQKIWQEVVNRILPEYYRQVIVKHNLRPVIDPKVQVVKMEEGTDWQFKITACEAPEVKLGDYQKVVKDITAKDKIWVPGKTAEPAQKPDKNKKLAEIMEALLKAVEIPLSPLLVESEQNRMLSRLLAQTEKLGLTIDQYAQANHKTVDVIRTEYATLASRNLKTEFLMETIARQEKITVSDQEVDQYLAAVKDQELKTKLSTPEQKAYLRLTLIRQKTLDFLLAL